MKSQKISFWGIVKDSGEIFTENINYFLKLSYVFFIPFVVLIIYFKVDDRILRFVLLNLNYWWLLYVLKVIYLLLFLFWLSFYLISIFISVEALQKKKSIEIKRTLLMVRQVFGGYLITQLLLFGRSILWGMLFIIPGIIYFVLHSFCGLCYVVDNKQKNESLLLSRAILKKTYNKYLDYQLFLALLFSVTLWPILIGFDSAVSLFEAKGFLFLAFVMDFFTISVIAAICVFVCIFYFNLYVGLKERSTYQQKGF